MALTALDALRTLQRALDTSRADEIPEGWLSADQWAKEAKMSRVNAHKILFDAEKAGMVESREFRVATGRGVRRVKHYRKPQ